MSAESQFRRTIEALATWEEVAVHVAAVLADIRHPHWLAAWEYAARIAFDEDDETPTEDNREAPAENPEPDASGAHAKTVKETVQRGRTASLAPDLGKSARRRTGARPRRRES